MGYIEDDIKNILSKRMESIKDKVAQRMDALHRTTTGQSVNSLAIIFPKSMEAYLEGDAQWQVMQKGRSPGKGPYNFREIIKKWIDDKGITAQPKGNQTEEAAKNSLAFLITRSILEKGTSLHRNNSYNDIYDSVVDEEVFKMQREAGACFELAVDKINDNFIKDGY